MRWMINTSPIHRTTFTPYDVMYGRRPQNGVSQTQKNYIISVIRLSNIKKCDLIDRRHKAENVGNLILICTSYNSEKQHNEHKAAALKKNEIVLLIPNKRVSRIHFTDAPGVMGISYAVKMN